MNILKAIFCFLLLVPSIGMAQLDQQSNLEITPSYTSVPPSVDGKLDDRCWESAAIATNFRLNNGKGLAKCGTVAKICYDAEQLYIAFECVEPETEKLTAIYDSGDPVWRDDCVEVFVSPHAMPAEWKYQQFVVNCAGKKTCATADTEAMEHGWKAAASIGEGRWFAEIAIPFKALGKAGTNEPYWRIQFCRSDVVHSELSSWSEVVDRFASLWRFGRLMQPENGPKFIQYRGKPQPIGSRGTPYGARVIKSLPAEVPTQPVIIPEPRIARFHEGSFRITPETRILVGKSSDPMDRRPAEEINDELRRVAGFTLPIETVESGGGVDWRGAIVVGERWINPTAEGFAASKGIRLSRGFPGKEGYVLEVGPDGILVSGSDQAGTFWAAQTLRQLIRRSLSGKSATVPCASIRDWPGFRYRGVHLLATPDSLSFHGRMIEKILSRFKINNIVLQCDYLEWKSHPEIRNPTYAVKQDDIRQLIKIANDHHITVTPMIQSLGHLNWAFYNNSNLDMAEDVKARYALCPRSPKSHQFMADLFDEVIALFNHPEYVHAGLDEFDMRGEFPVHEECKRIGKEQLYIDMAVWDHDYLASRGVKMAMWGDILTRTGFREKIGQLPKDILICDWRYAGNKDYPTLGFYLENGFKVIGCTWYNPINLYYFSLDGKRRGIEGMMQTTWTGFWPEERVMREEFEQIHSYVLGAAWAWSPGRPKLEELPYESDQVFSELWFATESKPAPTWFSVDLSPFVNISLRDESGRIGWLGLGPGNDLSGLPEGVSVLGGIPYDLGSRRAGILLGGPKGILEGFGERIVGIPVGSKADRLYFLHTTAFADRTNRKVGEYTIHYEDGSSAKVELIYGQTISAWDWARPASRNRSAWRGVTHSGDVIRVNTLMWDNPHPDKRITALDFASYGDAGPVLIAVTGERRGE